MVDRGSPELSEPTSTEIAYGMDYFLDLLNYDLN